MHSTHRGSSPRGNHYDHHPRGDERDRITSARKAAEALFTPKRQPAERSVSDPVPSVEQPARKPRVLSSCHRHRSATRKLRHRSTPSPGPRVISRGRTMRATNLGELRVDDPPSRRGLRGRRRRDRAHPPASLTSVRSKGSRASPPSARSRRLARCRPSGARCRRPR